MSALDFDEGVYYPKGTMYAVVESLVKIGKKAGVHYHANAGVKRIITKEGRAKGILLESGEKIEADIVISNADLHFTETKLLKPSEQTYPMAYWISANPAPAPF